MVARGAGHGVEGVARGPGGQQSGARGEQGLLRVLTRGEHVVRGRGAVTRLITVHLENEDSYDLEVNF